MTPMGELREPPEWMAEALCRGVPTEVFFPHRGDRIPGPIRDACVVCPHAVECLSFALIEEIRFGQWGGLGERARGALRARGVYRTAAVTVRYRSGVVTMERHQPAPCSVVEARAALVDFIAHAPVRRVEQLVAV